MTIILLTKLFTALLIPAVNAQVQEIPDPNINDIAMVVPYGSGVAIIYNPIICNAAGPHLCEFYKAHEYGHVNLGHLPRRTHPSQAEAEADCWAARHAPRLAVEAAFNWFIRGGGASWHHGTGQQRAARLQICSR